MNLLINSCFLSSVRCPCVGGSFRSGVQPPTGSRLGVFAPGMFSGLVTGEGARLGPLLFSALERGRAGFDIHRGRGLTSGIPNRWRGRGGSGRQGGAGIQSPHRPEPI